MWQHQHGPIKAGFSELTALDVTMHHSVILAGWCFLIIHREVLNQEIVRHFLEIFQTIKMSFL